MKCRVTESFVFVMLVVCSQLASGQEFEVAFRNAMRTISDVTLTDRSSGRVTTFTIGSGDQGNIVGARLGGGNYDVQVIPRDAPSTGYRFTDVNLRQVMADAVSGVIDLDGEFAPGKKKWVCEKVRGCGCRTYCRCYLKTMRGERIAVGLIAKLKNGEEFRMEVPKSGY